eukprot:7614197-Pyramimonas_sp.AAC.1
MSSHPSYVSWPHRSSTEGPVAQSACVSLTQYNVSWPRMEPHRRSPWRSPHASPSPSTALRGPIGSSTDRRSPWRSPYAVPPPKKCITIAVLTPAYGWVFRQANF